MAGGAVGVVVNHHMQRGLTQQELLQPSAVAYIQPGVGSEEAVYALRIEQAQRADIKVCVENRSGHWVGALF